MYYECSKKMFTIRQISDKVEGTKNNSSESVYFLSHEISQVNILRGKKN